MTRPQPAFPNVCVVGLGNHAKTKLIPALLANGQKIVGLVSTQASADIDGARRFERLDGALDALPHETLFVLASPPAAHFAQALQVLEAGRDVIVEKPAFETCAQAVEAFAAADARGRVLAEAFMNRHTVCHQRAIAQCRARKPDIATIEIVFTIPSLPGGTFRGKADLASSGLYDMGCYGLSLLDDLDLPLDAIELTGRALDGPDRQEMLLLSGNAEGIAVTIRVGVAAEYANTLTFGTRGGETITYAPFFYGRPGQRTVASMLEGRVTRTPFEDHNAFEAMFAVSRADWLASQPARRKSVIAVTGALERLGAELLVARGLF